MLNLSDFSHSDPLIVIFLLFAWAPAISNRVRHVLRQQNLEVEKEHSNKESSTFLSWFDLWLVVNYCV